MLACRLCLRFGIPDPVAWLDSVSPQVWRLWRAFDRIEPVGGEDDTPAASPIAAMRQLEARFGDGNGNRNRSV